MPERDEAGAPEKVVSQIAGADGSEGSGNRLAVVYDDATDTIKLYLNGTDDIVQVLRLLRRAVCRHLREVVALHRVHEDLVLVYGTEAHAEGDERGGFPLQLDDLPLQVASHE
jgi:hypothetical protein